MMIVILKRGEEMLVRDESLPKSQRDKVHLGRISGQSRFSYSILLMCMLIAAVDAIDLSAMGFVAPAIIDSWHISKVVFSWVLTGSLLGSTLGAFGGGPLADAIGRKKVLILCLLLFGSLTVACAFAESVQWLVALRFVSGLAMGAATPVATTLVSEYASDTHHSVMVNTQTVGYLAGATLGGLLAAWVIPNFGWQGMLVVGGALPLILATFLLPCLPESIQFMIARGWPQEKIDVLINRFSIVVVPANQKVDSDKPKVIHFFSGLGKMFKGYYFFGTLAMWIVYCLGISIYFLFVSWLPTIMRAAGNNIAHAEWISSMFPLGGAIGTIVIGALMDRFSFGYVVSAAFVLGGAAIWLISTVPGSIVMLSVLVLIAGATLVGATFSIITLTTKFYPAMIRSTGVAWLMAVGRVGGIGTVTLGGMLLQLHWNMPTIFELLSIPAFLASIVLLAAKQLIKSRAAQPIL